MRRLTAFAAAALVALPGIAHAAEPACLTPREFTSLSAYAMPSVIRGTAQRCTAVLPGSAFLKQDGAKLAARYEGGKAAAWPSAKAVFLKMGAGTNPQASELFRSMPDDTLQPLVDNLIQGMVGQQLPTERCTVVDRMVQLLAPLPAENTAELIALAAGLGAKSGKARVGQFSLCPA